MVIQIGLQKLNLIGNGDSNWIRNGEQQKNADSNDDRCVRKITLPYIILWHHNSDHRDHTIGGYSDGADIDCRSGSEIDYM